SYGKNANMTRYAIWAPLTYTITYKVDGETVAEYSFKCDETITGINVTAPTKVGSTFGGWDTTLPETMPAKNLVINAVWGTNNYTIKFMDDTTVLSEATYAYGAAVTAPAAPTKEGFTFAGWVDADGKATAVPTTMPAGNVTLYASWTENEKPVEPEPEVAKPAINATLFALAARYAQRFDVLVSAENAIVTGDMTIKYKRTGTVEIAVAEGYQLVDVIANGQSLGAVTSVTFKKVMAPQTLVVVTEPIPTEEPAVEEPVVETPAA
ncbi:MAG: InlB B-repeat-containing protein, partial [Clostridia bacterium]|nr:InlB B-repeat-containing protein [Clostridia bacterium]